MTRHLPFPKDLLSSLADYLVPLLLIGFSLTMAIRSSGFFELDELTHFMKSRECWTDWHCLLDVWGRPLCTGLYALTAPFGLPASRILAVFVAVVTGIGTAQLGKVSLQLLPAQARYHRSLLWLLLFAQPLYMLQSFAVMTEMLLAASWVWAIVALANRRLLPAGLLVGLGGLARPEGWLAIIGWPVMLWLSGRRDEASCASAGVFPWKFLSPCTSMLLAVIPTLLWWVVGWLTYGSAVWLLTDWPWPFRSPYGKTPGQFALALLIALALWMVLPVATGMRLLWSRFRHGDSDARSATFFILAPLLGLVTLHGFLALFGLFGSLSLPRYFVMVAPFVAVLSSLGIQGYQGPDAIGSLRRPWFTDGRGKRAGWFWVMIGMLAVLPMVLLVAAGQLPVAENIQFRRLDEAIRWVRENQEAVYSSQTASGELARSLPFDPNPANVVAAHPYIYYRLGVPLSCLGHRMAFSAASMRAAPVGTVAIVENVIWEYDGFARRDQLMTWGYELVKRSRGVGTAKRAHWSLSILQPLGGRHLLSLVGDAAQVEVWVKRR
ncbi:MAG: hypothetical protein HY644_06645 [Acidobacteria bacterium]|nr:hypothetical protein [Acidobacteriota bacterium]